MSDSNPDPRGIWQLDRRVIAAEAKRLRAQGNGNSPSSLLNLCDAGIAQRQAALQSYVDQQISLAKSQQESAQQRLGRFAAELTALRAEEVILRTAMGQHGPGLTTLTSAAFFCLLPTVLLVSSPTSSALVIIFTSTTSLLLGLVSPSGPKHTRRIIDAVPHDGQSLSGDSPTGTQLPEKSDGAKMSPPAHEGPRLSQFLLRGGLGAGSVLLAGLVMLLLQRSVGAIHLFTVLHSALAFVLGTVVTEPPWQYRNLRSRLKTCIAASGQADAQIKSENERLLMSAQMSDEWNAKKISWQKYNEETQKLIHAYVNSVA